MTEELGKIGKYELIGEIATGGMGTVYQAYDPFRDEFIALKVPKMNAESMSKYDFERLFFNETNAASRLHHPYIIEVYDAGVADGVHYIAMEYVPGGLTLKRFCRADNLLPLEIVGKILLNAAEALDYAHRKGVMHRDIKASNILLKNDRDVKISDFGLAMLTDPDMVATQSMKLMGSPKYMAPERLNEEGVTNQSDLYSLGVVMYELLTGHTPFEADTVPALTRKILTADVTPPSVYRDVIPKEIDSIVLEAIARDPADRYKDMMAFAADISACFKDLHVPIDGGMAESRTEQLKGISFFSEFPDADIWELLRWSEWLEVKQGDVIITEGDIDHDVYLTIKGLVSVVKEGNEVAELESGEFFGEIAFLAERKRSASVVAKTNCTLLRMNIKQIEQASKSCQIQFQRMFITTLTNRLVTTTQQLAHQYSEK